MATVHHGRVTSSSWAKGRHEFLDVDVFTFPSSNHKIAEVRFGNEVAEFDMARVKALAETFQAVLAALEKQSNPDGAVQAA